ncbi:hypothetical protein S83_011869, partial [Arachis hypogaea]
SYNEFFYQAIHKTRGEIVNRFQKRKKVADPAFWFNAEEFEKHRQTTSGMLD